MNFIIMGCHGTGKDTCVNYLQHKQPDYVPILPGQMIRTEIQLQTPLGKVLQPLYEGNNLEHQHEAEELLNNYACELSCNKITQDALAHNKPFILNGFPRSWSSFETMHTFFQHHRLIENIHVVYLEASDATCLERMSTRLICPHCATTHIGVSTHCNCGALLIARKTDTQKLARERVRFYRSATHELADTIKKSYRFTTIDTERSFEELKKEYDALV